MLKVMTTSQSRLENDEIIRKLIADLEREPGALLPLLHGIQDELGYIPADSVSAIAKGLNLSKAEVHGVISFYHHFRSTPPGRRIIRICRAEACQSMGGNALISHIKLRLGIDFHETTGDRGITLEPIYCLGNCACAPSVMIGEQLHGRVTPEKFDRLLQAAKEEQ
ncbi:MAG: formate dehydrogenase subunit gamma [Burkholderiales bacterium]